MLGFDPRRWSLARQVFALLTAALVAIVAVGVGAAYLQARRAVTAASRTQALSVAQTIANSPVVGAAIGRPDPSAVLQPYAERIRRSTGTDFITIMSPAGIRYSHRNRALIGQRFVGHTAVALSGRPFTETYTGTLGPSVRAVVPVFAADSSRVVALVAVGVLLENIGSATAREVPLLLGAGAALLLASSAAAWLLSRRLRRQTGGLGASELTRMAEFYDAVLHAVREGLLILDREGRVQLVNDEGRRLLGLPEGVVGRPVGELGLPAELTATLAGSPGPPGSGGSSGSAGSPGSRRVDELQLTADRVLVVSRSPARWNGRDLGSVVTFRDHTDMVALSGELSSARGLAESLRSQAHEAANRLHALITMIELGRTDQALEFATVQLADAQELTDRVIGAIQEPVLAALLLGKAAEAAERGVRLVLADGLDVPAAIDGRDLVTIVGNLLDNALDAALAGAPGSGAERIIEVAGSLGPDGELVLRVGNSGAAIDPAHGEQIFERDWSTKSAAGRIGGRGLGLALVRQAVLRHGGTLRVESPAQGPVSTVFEVRLPATALAGLDG